MLEIITHITFCAILCAIIWQDLRDHAISLYLLLALFPLSILLALANHSMIMAAENYLLNISFLLLVFAVLFCYVSLKKRRLTNFIDDSVGLGDILFLGSAAFLFDPASFVLAFLAITLLIIVISFSLAGTKAFSLEIPYAGIWSIAIVLMLFLKQLKVANLFSDHFYKQAISFY